MERDAITGGQDGIPVGDSEPSLMENEIRDVSGSAIVVRPGSAPVIIANTL